MSLTSLSTEPATRPRTRHRLYSGLIGLTSFVVLLQGLWAGLFVREGKEYTKFWVDVHARGAEIAILLAIAATVVAVSTLRHRRDLVVGSGALVGLLVVEAYLGGMIGNHSGLSAIHFPLAMSLLALSVWLPLRAVRG